MNNQISDIIIPASVTYIGDDAFRQDEDIWESATILYNAINLQTRFDNRASEIGWVSCGILTHKECV